MFWIKSGIPCVVILWAYLHQYQTEAALNYYTKDEQIANLANVFADCKVRQKEFSQSNYNVTELACPIDFNNAVCWPRTKANETAIIQCPSYVNMFDTSEKAYRQCSEYGNWSYDFIRDVPQIDYSSCMRAAKALDTTLDVTGGEEIDMSLLVQAHIGRIRMMYTVGYSVSVISLIAALIIMMLLRRLHCPRNTIHMNMFVSFILRGGIQLLREFLHGTAIGTAISDTTAIDLNGIEEDILATTGWQCKLLSTVWMYTRLSNCVWIFIEGIYLHTLIFINTFSDKSSIKWFVLAGWGFPLLSVIPWMLVRVYLDDFRCWTIYKNRDYRWIIEVPIVCLIVVNFIFFLIIIRLLFTKLKASESRSREARIYRYIKLAKSTLVLIPLFGVHYVVFLFGEFFTANETLELIRFYFDTFFTSFQGLMVGVLFCFMNGEVRTEIIKKWKRWRTLQNMQLPSMSTQLNVTQRTSIGSEQESVNSNRNQSRQASIQSSKSSTSSSPPLQPLAEETQNLLSIDDNQNELRLKQSLDNDQVQLIHTP